ncbi:MAG: dienelactone hydrolase family protein [Ornithinimicrobium sp.]
MVIGGTSVTSPDGARLTYRRRPDEPVALVLTLHGGQAWGTEPTSWRQASVLRVMPFTRELARAGRGGIAVAHLRYAVRGWNAHGDPLRDARWALAQIDVAHPGLPIGLVGYSMGGRVALHLAGECRAQVLVTLAAWVEPAEIPSWRPCPGLTALMMHGSADQVTDPAGTQLAAAALRQGGAGVEVEIVPGDTHTLLRRPTYWHRRVSDFVVGNLSSTR